MQSFLYSKINSNIKQLTDRNTTKVHYSEKQLRVIKLEEDKGLLVLINLSDAIRELKNLTSELNIKNYLAYHFIQTNLILELYLSKTSILLHTNS